MIGVQARGGGDSTYCVLRRSFILFYIKKNIVGKLEFPKKIIIK